jgi:prepilin-type N-terminal cleavage/methylation domain-containing protein
MHARLQALPIVTEDAHIHPSRAARACASRQCGAVGVRPIARPAGENAFSMIEVVVVMLILGILVGGIVTSSRGTRGATELQVASGTARSYADAAIAFANDHGGRPPELGSDDWPAGRTARFADGPVNVSADDHRYLVAPPEAAVTGQIPIVDAAAPAEELAATEAVARIRYTVEDAAWRIDVDVNEAGGWRSRCSFGTLGTVREC